MKKIENFGLGKWMENIISPLIIMLMVLLIWFPSKIEASIINKYFSNSNDTTIIHTSFEADETPTYALGTINNQDNWSVVSGSGEVVEDSIYARQGGRGLNELSGKRTRIVFAEPSCAVIQKSGRGCQITCLGNGENVMTVIGKPVLDKSNTPISGRIKIISAGSLYFIAK